MHTSLNEPPISSLKVKEEIIHTTAQSQVDLRDDVKILKPGGHVE